MLHGWSHCKVVSLKNNHCKNLDNIFDIIFIDSNDKLVARLSQQRFQSASDVISHPDNTSTKATSSHTSIKNPSSRKSPIAATRSSPCSDYYSDTGSRRGAASADGSASTAVDFTEQSATSPLFDFGRKERDYVSKVIQIACQRTSLLRKSKFSATSGASASTNTASGATG